MMRICHCLLLSVPTATASAALVSYSNLVTWNRLAQTCGEFLGKGQQVAIEGRIQTRSRDDDRGQRQCQVRPVG
jgi:single-strand DNA-binding protein